MVVVVEAVVEHRVSLVPGHNHRNVLARYPKQMYFNVLLEGTSRVADLPVSVSSSEV